VPGIGDPLEVFEKRVMVLKQLGVKAIVGLKPRTQEEIIARMRLAEAAGAVAFTIDVDSSGRAARALPGRTVEDRLARYKKHLGAGIAGWSTEHDRVRVLWSSTGGLKPDRSEVFADGFKNLADGIVVAGCSESTCYNRLGVEWTKQRFAGARDPYLRKRVPRERLATIWASPFEGGRYKTEKEAFAASLSGPQTVAPPLVTAEPDRPRPEAEG